MEEQKIVKHPEVRVSVNRKVNLGDYNNVELRVTLSSGTVENGGMEELEEKTEELADLATEKMHDKLERVTGRTLTSPTEEALEKVVEELVNQEDEEFARKTMEDIIDEVVGN